MRAWLIVLALAASGTVHGQSWTFTDAERTRLDNGEVLVSASVAGDRSQGDVRAAVLIHASAEKIFQVMTDCDEALKYVPHLEHCAVLESADDGSWQVVEQRVDYSWFMPNTYYVFRAEYEKYRRIRFSHVRGDFRENSGVWELMPVDDDTAIIVMYQVHIVPRFFVPRWMMRGALRRDLPAMLKGLRELSETENQPERVARLSSAPAQ